MHKIKVRWVILNKNKIFLVREVKKHFYYLPWGTLEWNESLKECLDREIQEELGVKPVIWKLLNIEEFRNDSGLYLDIWFEITNFQDFEYIHKNNATHAFEYYDEGFYSFEELEWKDVRPWHGHIEKIVFSGGPQISLI